IGGSIRRIRVGFGLRLEIALTDRTHQPLHEPLLHCLYCVRLTCRWATDLSCGVVGTRPSERPEDRRLQGTMVGTPRKCPPVDPDRALRQQRLVEFEHGGAT